MKHSHKYIYSWFTCQISLTGLQTPPPPTHTHLLACDRAVTVSVEKRETGVAWRAVKDNSTVKKKASAWLWLVGFISWQIDISWVENEPLIRASHNKTRRQRLVQYFCSYSVLDMHGSKSHLYTYNNTKTSSVPNIAIGIKNTLFH